MLCPNPEGFSCKLERNEKEGVWKDVFSNFVSQVHAQRRALRVERTFMEYGSTSRKDAMIPFSTSSAIVGRGQGTLIQVKELNPFNSGLDHVRSSSVRK